MASTLEQPHDGGHGDGPLKIVVAGTPKTGNTWVKFLLATIYELPLVELQANHAADDWSAFGPRWIGHQHYQPESELLERARANGVTFVTVLRHPADVLVSLWHFVRASDGEVPGEVALAASMRGDGDTFGECTRRFVEHGFFLSLHASICWLNSGASRILRYEELWERPVETLVALTNRIRPVPRARIERAVAACEISRLRRQSGSALFRRGGTGAWKRELPRELQRMLQKWEPYPAQFAALGYAMRAEGGAGCAALERELPRQFDNGAAIVPVLRQLHASLPRARRERWPAIASTAEHSFYAWLNAPAAADPAGGRSAPTITELAHHLYTIRSDVQALYPAPFGRSRLEFGNWFAYFAPGEYGLDEAFTLPVIQSVARRQVETGNLLAAG